MPTPPTNDPDVTRELPEVAAPAVNAPTLAVGEATRPSDAPRPVLIGRFRIVEPIGEGGFSVVYRAHDTQLERDVALKVAKPEQLQTAIRVKRFLREARESANLAHPHIVQVFDAGRDGMHFYIAQALVTGGSLDHEISRLPAGKGMEPSKAVTIVQKVAEALAYAHRQGVIHRDVKPANVLLDERGEPRLADFGLAARLDDEGARLTEDATKILGTLEYMAPEQYEGKAEAASDQYSLGVTLYELLTGERPFQGHKAAMKFVHQNEPVPPMRKVPRDLETICRKCLEKSPTDRYANCDELAEDIGRYLRGEATKVRPAGPVERVIRWCRRNPKDAGFVLGIVVVIALAFTGMAALWSEAVGERRTALKNEADARDQKRIAQENELDARHQEELARKSAQEARSVAKFLAGVFESSDPFGLTNSTPLVAREAGEKLTVRAALARGTEKLNAADLSPEAAAILKGQIGAAFLSLGDLKAAEPMLVESLRLRRQLYGDEHAEVAAALHSLGWLSHTLGRYVEAEDRYREALAMRERLGTVDELEIAETQFFLGWLLVETYDCVPSRQLFESVLEVRTRRLGADHRLVAFAHLGVASALFQEEKSIQALPHNAAARDILLRGADDRLVKAVDLFQRSIIQLNVTGDLEAAAVLLRECDAIVCEWLSPRHLYRALVLGQLALVQKNKGDGEAAEASVRQCIELAKNQVGTCHPRVVFAVEMFADLLRDRGAVAEADRFLADWVAEHRALGAGNPFLADALTVQAVHLRNTRRARASLAVLEEATRLFRVERRPWKRPPSLRALTLLAWELRRAGRLAEAEQVSAEFLAALKEFPAVTTDDFGVGLYQRGRILLSMRRLDGEIEDVLTSARQKLRPLTPFHKLHEDYWDVLLTVAELRVLQGRPSDAAREARQAARSAPDEEALVDVAGCLARCESLEPGKGYGDEAVRLVATAVEKGFKNRSYLRRAADFHAVRSRPDFRKLAGLEGYEMLDVMPKTR